VNRTEDFRACANIDPIAENGRAPLSGIPQAHRDPIANDAIIAKNRVATDDNSSEMIDTKTTADDGLTWKFNSCEYFGEKLENLVER
jgi:hypothetical protein